jgi:hypothetical protein
MEALSALSLIVLLMLVILALGAAVGVPAAIPLTIGILDRSIPRIARLTLIAAPVSFALTIVLLVRALRDSHWHAWVGVPPPIEIKIVFLPALLLGIAGVAILAYGTRRKSDSTARAGAWVVAAAIGDAVVAALYIGSADAG